MEKYLAEIEVNIDDPDGIIVQDIFEVEVFEEETVETGTVDSSFWGSPCREQVTTVTGIFRDWIFSNCEDTERWRAMDQVTRDRVEMYIDNHVKEL